MGGIGIGGTEKTALDCVTLALVSVQVTRSGPIKTKWFRFLPTSPTQNGDPVNRSRGRPSRKRWFSFFAFQISVAHKRI